MRPCSSTTLRAGWCSLVDAARPANSREKTMTDEEWKKMMRDKTTNRILHLHVRKEYWDKAVAGKKQEEYRLVKPYWVSRLYKKYDFIHYHLGYATGKTEIFRYDGFTIKTVTHKEFGDKPVRVYAISLRGRL